MLPPRTQDEEVLTIYELIEAAIPEKRRTGGHLKSQNREENFPVH
jgi:hypothetical protein